MTEVAFHAGLPDTLGYACRLLRKAWRQRLRLTVTGPPEALRRLDAQLWVFEPGSFIPHALLGRGQSATTAMEPTPIWLTEEPGSAPPAQVLVNLGTPLLPAFSRFERVVELVGADPEDAAQGRLRWRLYLAAGITPVLHQAPLGA
jgi:DNA polymerase-3 subunit chi